MSHLDSLLDRLRKNPQAAEDPWATQRQAWVDDLAELRDTISGWLSAAVNEGLMTLEPLTIPLQEDDLGTYEAPALHIHVNASGPRVIKVEPTAMRVVGVIPAPGVRILGAVGRVDLRCGPSRAMLLRQAPGQWQFVGVDRGFSSGDYVADLTADSLAEVIDELLG